MQQIVEVDEKKQTIISNGWLDMVNQINQKSFLKE
jgi:hypothetical protein